MNTTVSSSTTTTGTDAIGDLIARVIDKFDTNKDKQLNAEEFGGFLRGLLGGATNTASSAGTNPFGKLIAQDGGNMATVGGTTPATGGSTTATSQADFNPTTANWNLLHGFSAANYYNANMQSMKYMFARIAADYDPRQPGALDRLVADPRFAAAFPKAKVVGKDTIDFGGQLSDGSKGVPVSLVDVGEAFFDNGSGTAWQWLDQARLG